MKPQTAFVLFKMLKSGLRDPQKLPHLASVLRSHLDNVRKTRPYAGPKALLIALIEHMGDIIAAEPLSRLARRTHPDSKIYWVSKNSYREVVENFEAVEGIIEVGCMTEWLLLWSRQRDDVVWDLHISERPCPRCGIAYSKPGRPGTIRYDNYYSFGNLITVNCINANLPALEDAPRIRPPDAAVRKVDSLHLPNRFVAIHCKSNEERRDWQLDKWKALVAHITEQTDVAVIEIGAEPHVVREPTHNSSSLCGALSIMETAEVIRRATLFIGIDSGPAHLANATGTRGIVLLGRYQNFAAYTPYSGGYGDGSRADLVRSSGPAADIEVEVVWSKVQERLHGFPVDTP